MWRRRTLALFPALLCALLSGCLGGQTGTEERRAGGPGPTLSDSYCDRHPIDIGIDEISPLGFSAREALNVALGPRSAPLAWSAPGPTFDFGPEMGEGTLSLVVSSSASRARFVHYELANGAGALVSRCPPDEIEIDATADFETSGGALSEQAAVTLRAVSSSSVRLAVDLRLDALTGSFYVSLPTGSSAPLLSIGVEIDPQGLRGALSGLLERRVGQQVSAGRVVYACFPAGAVGCSAP